MLVYQNFSWRNGSDFNIGMEFYYKEIMVGYTDRHKPENFFVSLGDLPEKENHVYILPSDVFKKRGRSNSSQIEAIKRAVMDILLHYSEEICESAKDEHSEQNVFWEMWWNI